MTVRREITWLTSGQVMLLVALLLLLASGALRAQATGNAGDVSINGRLFDLSAAAEISIDGQSVDFDQMRARIGDGRGMRTEAIVMGANTTLTGGTIDGVTFENNFKGPITSIEPLRVLGQPFTVNGDTTLVGFTDVAQLALGQFLEVSGFIDVDSSVVASRVAVVSAPNEWKLTGFVTFLDTAAQQAIIGVAPGGQRIAFVGVVPEDCGAGLAVGDHVDVRANPIAPFEPGQIVDTVTRLRCRPIVPIGTIGSQGAFEGLIQAVVDDTTFSVAGYTVTHGAATVFRFGNVDDLEAGVRVEVEGTFTAADAFTARRIKFIRPSIRFRAPVAPADVTPGESITILGKTVLANAQNRDENGIMANGLATTTHVEVRAYADSTGALFATRVRSRGGPDPTDYELQGLAESITRPNLVALGITIDTALSAFQDREENPISADAFFAAIEPGTLVGIEDASFDAANNRLYGGIVSISDDDATAQPAFVQSSSAKGAVSARVSGALQAVARELPRFKDGFEAP